MGMQQKQTRETVRSRHGQVEKDQVHLPSIAREHLEDLIDRSAGDQLEIR